MDEELRCPHCSSFYHVPVLLQCRHALCLSCASALQKPCTVSSGPCLEGSPVVGTDDADKASVLSDADSGVSSCSSRPTSLVGAPEGGIGGFYTIKCPKCDLDSTIDEVGSGGLPKFRVLGALVDRHLERLQVAQSCSFCSPNGDKVAEAFCDTCLAFYCSSCRDAYHAPNGPLDSHWLVSVAEGRAILRARKREREGKCVHHNGESVSMYCMTCRRSFCVMCLHQGRHHAHDVHALNAASKAHKTELSQALQQLSERARAATDFIHSLKALTEEVNGNCREVEGVLVAQIDALIEALQDKRSHLINFVRNERDAKVRILREQAQDYTQTLQTTTGAIHFCIEAMKEADPAAFMEAQEVLEDRIESLSTSLNQAVNPEPRVPPTFDLSLEDKSLLNAITRLTFAQLKPPYAPSFVASDCSAENNSVTVCWAPHEYSATSGYVLQIDDGADGPFKEVYQGEETMCTIDGLHFNSLYRARVRAFNDSGVSPYSEMLRLQTAEVASFHLVGIHPDLTVSNADSSIRSDSYEHRVALGSAGFFRGTHYWQLSVDRHEDNADVAVGVAARDVLTDTILGRCENSWSMYIDGERSWLMHEGDHFSRTPGGIRVGDDIGVLLSCSQKTISFFVNGSLQGSMVLSGTSSGTALFPAVSLNRSSSLTLQTGLPIPQEFLEDQSSLTPLG